MQRSARSLGADNSGVRQEDTTPSATLKRAHECCLARRELSAEGKQRKARVEPPCHLALDIIRWLFIERLKLTQRILGSTTTSGYQWLAQLTRVASRTQPPRRTSPGCTLRLGAFNDASGTEISTSGSNGARLPTPSPVARFDSQEERAQNKNIGLHTRKACRRLHVCTQLVCTFFQDSRSQRRS